MYASMNETFVALQHIDVLPKRDSKFLLWYRVYGVFSPEQLKNVTVETASYGEVGRRLGKRIKGRLGHRSTADGGNAVKLSLSYSECVFPFDSFVVFVIYI